ncbi:MAG: hypothetical protein EA416_12260 [Trueperaceae bacterium]|nr:MAG: hypothetical protein EA416_12260 [Trueperaceae bacterium]
MAACGDGGGTAPAVLSVAIDGGPVDLPVGSTLVLGVTVEVVGGASTAVAWSSGDDGVATVSDGGVVEGVAEGSTVVTATSVLDASRSASVAVTVVPGQDADVPDGAEVLVAPVAPLPGSDVSDLRVVSRMAESHVGEDVGEARFTVPSNEVSLVSVVDVARSFGWMAIVPAWFEAGVGGVTASSETADSVGPLSTAVAILFSNPAFYHDDVDEASAIIDVLRALPEVGAFADALEEYAAEARPSEHPVVFAAFEAAYDAGIYALGDALGEAASTSIAAAAAQEGESVVRASASGILVRAVDQDAVRFAVDEERSFIQPEWSAGYQRWAGERTVTWLGRLYEVDTDEVSRSEVEARFMDRWNPDFAVRLDAPDRRLRLDAEYSWVAEAVDPIGLSFELLRTGLYWAMELDQRGLEVPEGAYVSHMVTCILGFAGEGRRNDLTFLSEWNDVHDGVSRFDLGLACAQNVIEGGLDALGILPLDVGGILSGLIDAGDDDVVLLVETVVNTAIQATAGADMWSSSDYMNLFYGFVIDAATIAAESVGREGAKAVTDGLLGFLNYLGRVSSAAKTGARIGTMLRVTPLERHTIIVGDPWANGGPGPGDDEDEVVVSVVPASVTLLSNGTQAFSAMVSGASDRSVTWDATCGSLSGSGSETTFTAPTSAGECAVRATSVADSGAWGEAIVTVEAPGDVSPERPTGTIAAGNEFSLAVREDGTVWAWGENGAGQLGDGTTTHRSLPVQVAGLSNVRSVAAGWEHSLAVREDGTVWEWGENELSPVQVVGLSEVRSVAADDRSSAVREDGTVWAWRWQSYHSSPKQVGGLSNMRSVALGHYNYAVSVDGTLWAYGHGSHGYLTWQFSDLSGVQSAASGYVHSLLVRDDGTVWAWGSNAFGQLGVGTTSPGEGLVQVVGLSNVRF